MDPTALRCGVEARRKKLFGNPSWNGLDFLEVSDDQRSLCVHFFGRVPEGITVDNVRIEGGRRIRDLRVVKVEIDRAHDPELDDCLHITLDRFGDFSTYRVCLVQKGKDPAGGGAIDLPYPGIDPRYACLDFSFKVDCPSDLDCQQPPDCPPHVFPAPEINYLAKDYASFRQQIFDRLALIMPDWQERHVPDLGVTLVELLAYAGDYLSYYQDAVATEAYLDTARQRISVRRHARLVDYRLHEGNNARAWVTVWTASDSEPLHARDFYFITGVPDLPLFNGHTVRHADLEQVPAEAYEVFEPLVDDAQAEERFYKAHSEILFYTWGDNECCLPKGATRATLLDEAPATPGRVLHLKALDVLIFEEVLGPTNGNPADADPAHRHAVRLTKITQGVDQLLGKQVLEIEWAAQDALPFSLCLSARLPAPDCRWIDNVSLARGNVVLVDHGRTLSEPLGPVETKTRIGDCACEGSVVESTLIAAPFRPALQGAPLTFGQPLAAGAAASVMVTQDPRLALPRVTLTEAEADAPVWLPRFDVLASGPDDRHFVAETDDDGRAHLRFGDGVLGRPPSAGARFTATYRAGNGPAGNVGRDTIVYIVQRGRALGGGTLEPRNPLPARGGRVPEPVAEAKLLAPHAFRLRRERAIIAEDYAELAQRNAKIQRAAAELRWMGSWYEAQVAVDPLGSEEASVAPLEEIAADLYRFRRIGHDLEVLPARYAPLDVALEICVLPHYLRGHVKADLLKAFGNRRLADGRRGFFHPDNLTFGDGIYLSKLIAIAKAVQGVQTAKVTRVKRLHAPAGDELESGVLAIGPMEVAQVDNDPSFPEHGKLELILRGGR